MSDRVETSSHEHATTPTGVLAPYDAVLLVSFGGPEGPDEVLPFLRRVTAGKNIPQERLVEVGSHYDARGGVSPINDECRALLTALRAELAARGHDLPVHWGNRNAAPMLTDAVSDLRAERAERVVALVTSAFSSYSSCRQYREDLAAAVTEVAGEPVLDDATPRIDKVRPFGLDDAYLLPFARLTADAFADLVESGTPAGDAHLLFVTHSIPVAMDEASGPPDVTGAYSGQQRRAAERVVALVAERLGVTPSWSLAYCSRSGPPQVPWLEPDVNDVIADLAQQGLRGVVVAPIGFVADHMEVVHDLDTEAALTAAESGLAFRRVSTVRDDREFVAGLVDLLEERAAQARGEVADPPGRPRSACPMGCCAGARGPRPALCGADDGAGRA